MDRTEEIRQRAYRIWEADGFPEGRDAEHWKQAAEELGTDLQATGLIPDVLPDLNVSSPSDTRAGQADGHVIDAGEGGTTDAPDEAQEGVDHPLSESDIADAPPARA